MDAIVKWVSVRHPIGQIVFFRNLIAFIPILLMLPAAGGLAVLKTRRPAAHVVRSLLGLGTMVSFFCAYALMPLAEAVAISQAGPIFLTALSVPLLGEKVGIRRWSAVVVGFAGVLIMMRPGIGVFDPVALFAVAGAAFYAVSMIAIRRLSATEPPLTIVFYFTLCATTAGALSLPFQWVTPAPADLALLVAIGLIGGVAQYCMTQAFRLAPVAIIAPYEYGALVFAMLLGYVIWNDVPDAFLLIGAAIVVGSGLYILHRETVLARRRAASAAG
jgi:drug/metabolite transporter (DMT)-like permease